MSVLRLGDRVCTRGEVPVKRLRVSGYAMEVLCGRIVELNADHVRVAVDGWATDDWDGSSCFGYDGLVREDAQRTKVER